jgi:hypothetical protein
MLIAYFPAAVSLIGLLVFAFSANANVKQIGFGCFVAGLAACLVLFHGPTLTLP